MTTDLTTRITELTAQIEEHLSEDEAAAQAAAGPVEGGTHWHITRQGTLDSRAISGDTSVGCSDGCHPSDAQNSHIARNDPARALRRVAATRALITFAFENAATIDGEWGDGHEPAEIAAGQCNDHGARAALQLLTIIASQWEEQQQ